jgi:hypothetical protein
MKIDITELQIKVKKAEGKKNENLLANVSLTFRGELGYFTISGFTFWKSKFGGYNLEVPQKPGFKYVMFEKSLMQKIKKEVEEKYEYEDIPVIEEELNK